MEKEQNSTALELLARLVDIRLLLMEVENLLRPILIKLFSLDEMRKKNRESIYLDGIENIQNGVLTYTDELLQKVKKAFDVDLVKQVPYDQIDSTAEFIIKEIIEKISEIADEVIKI